jgi:DNA-binding MarR family transcriptional regulator
VAAQETLQDASPRWLTPDELETWKALHLLFVTLPGALGSQLESDSSLSLLEYYVLAVLSEQPDGTLRVGQLAALAYSEPSRLSHLMRRLEERSLIRRRPDPDDGRCGQAILTDAGRAEVIKAAPGHVQRVRSLIFDVLDEPEQRVLREAVMKVLARLGVDGLVTGPSWPLGK